jgi:hypothetical protein
MAEEMIIFSKTFDLLAWLLPRVEKFPVIYRFSVTQRLTAAALDFQERLFLAKKQKGAARKRLLLEADADLDKVRLYLRLAHHWAWLSDGQYEHVSLMVAELGKLLGSWIKKL